MGHSVRDRDRQRIDPRGLSRAEAAAYIGVSAELVRSDGEGPAACRRRSTSTARMVWDRWQLDAAFDALSDTSDYRNPWDNAA